jgi:hypothetical protein
MFEEREKKLTRKNEKEERIIMTFAFKSKSFILCGKGRGGIIVAKMLGVGGSIWSSGR